MGVGILGPLIATGAQGGEAVKLGPRDRVVLAALAAWPTETLSAERLADALWGDNPPASWTKVVQGCIARIRRALGADAVVTGPQGYRLALPVDQVDVRRFERLYGRARELLTLGEPDRASYVVGEALALWRGRALVDLEGWPAARAVAERLAEMRRDADELRVDADLRAGRCRQVLAAAQALAAEEPLRERRWALLALAQHRAGAQGEALATIRRARNVLVRELGLDPGPELVDLERAILRQDRSLLVDAEAPETSATCPYLGLPAYDVDDAEAFFGRDADVAACLRRLGAAGALVVVGPSGSGKSSLVRAGVVAALRRDGRPVVVVSPGARPMEVLAALPPTGSQMVLAVDQCEEAIAHCSDPADQARFFAALVEQADRAPLVVALRADQLGAVSAHPGFARLVEQGLYLLGAMSEADLRAAIEGPARQAGLLLEPGLVDLLVREVGGEPGGLPLLSHALRQTWHRREGRTLTVSGYRDSGGIRDALTRSAEEIFAALSERGKSDARQLFLRLVTPGEEGEVLRRRVGYAELLSLQASQGGMEAAIEAFGAARLLSLDQDPQAGAGTVEIAHEALLTGWARLRVWMDETRDDLRTARRLVVAARDWLDSGRQASFLASGARLDAFAAWRDRSGLAITTEEGEFLDASRADQVRRLGEERTRRAREEALTRRARRRLHAIVAVLAVAALVACGLTVFAVAQQNRADRQARLAAEREARELSAAAVANLDVDPERSLLLALRAVEVTRSGDGSVRPEAIEALHRAVVASRVVLRVPGVGGAMDWSPDGSIFVTEGEEDTGRIDIYSATTGRVVHSFPGHDADINDVAFNGDGSMLATTGDDGLAKLWNPTTGTELLTLDGPGQQVSHPSFSADGRLLAAIWGEGSDGRLAFWPPRGVVRVTEVATGRSRDFPTADWSAGAVLSPDGARLAVVAPDLASTAVLDVLTGRQLVTTSRHEPGVGAISWSPDGRWLTSASIDGATRIWEAATGRLHATLSGHAGPVHRAAWTPDSTRVATGSQDGTAKLWEVTAAGGRELLTLSASDMGNGIVDLAFSSDGRRLMASADFMPRLPGPVSKPVRDVTPDPAVTPESVWVTDPPFTPRAGAGRAVRIWDISRTGDAEVINVPADGQWIGGATFTPNGRGVVASGADGSVALWDLATGQASITTGPDGTVGPRGPALGLSPGELVLPAAGPDGTVRLWDAATGERQATTHGDGRLAAISPDGRLLAITAGGGLIRIVDRTGTVLAEVREDPGFTVVGLRFLDADGRLLATTRGPIDQPALGGRVTIRDWANDRIVRSIEVQPTVRFDPTGTRAVIISDQPAIWDLSTNRLIADLDPSTGRVLDAAFSPDGTLIATAGVDTTVRVWDARSGAAVLVLRGHGSRVHHVTFSPDGSRLASVDVAGTLRVWELNPNRLMQIAKRELTRTLTNEECQQYLHLPRCPQP